MEIGETFAGPNMFANFDMSLSWQELSKRTIKETIKDDAQGLASQLAYYFFLAHFRLSKGQLGAN